MEPIIKVQNLKKYFPTKSGMLHAVDNVSFTIEQGKTLGVVGESGCGKSTLGRVVLHLLPATSGEILFDGKDISNPSKAELHDLRRNMQMVFQDPYSSINPRQSVAEIIGEPLKVYKICKTKEEYDARVKQLMEIVGLPERYEHSYPHELDGGRRQRIGIGRALALQPKFIVCDEPVSALDVSIQAQILNLMMDLQDEMNLTYIFVTHDLSVVKHISNEIVVMYLGQCVERAPSEELFANPLHPYTRALLAAIPIPSLKSRKKGLGVIHGEVTSPINPKPGCRFAPRCPYACDQCRSGEIPLQERSPGHFVACTRQ